MHNICGLLIGSHYLDYQLVIRDKAEVIKAVA